MNGTSNYSAQRALIEDFYLITEPKAQLGLRNEFGQSVEQTVLGPFVRTFKCQVHFTLDRGRSTTNQSEQFAGGLSSATRLLPAFSAGPANNGHILRLLSASVFKGIQVVDPKTNAG